MEHEEKEQQELDIFLLMEDFLRHAKRLWLLGLVLIVVCGAAVTYRSRSAFVPTYEAYASFTVRVANPLYSNVTSYNAKTAEVMSKTFPSILSSDLMKSRITEKLGIDRVPSMGVSAVAESSILTLTVKDSDPQRAYDVLNTVIECYPEVAEFVVGSTELVLLDESGIPQNSTNSYNLRSNAIKGGILGTLIWCALMAAMVLLKNTIQNEEQLRRTLNAPCLGQVPMVRTTRKKPHPLIHRIQQDKGFSESIRLLRLRVEKAMDAGDRKVLLISSAIPGEGKTTISVNLAAALAMKEKKVLLVDCDLRNPSVAKTLGITDPEGGEPRNLIDYLNGKITVLDLIQHTDVEGFDIVPGGAGGKGSDSALLSQDRMARLIQAARNLYDYVLLDTPPCSMLADASELAELAEAGMIVIRQDFASRPQIVNGVQYLSDSKLHIIGSVMNQVRKGFGSGHRYGYGYSYGYSYGYGKEKR